MKINTNHSINDHIRIQMIQMLYKKGADIGDDSTIETQYLNLCST